MYQELYYTIIYLGTNVHRRYLSAYEIANVFTKKAALALAPFHAFTGCDKVNTSGHLQKESELFSLTRSTTYNAWYVC